VEFVDDYCLALVFSPCEPISSPRFAFIDTEQTPIDPNMAQTTFNLDLREGSDVDKILLQFDQGGHKPSSEEALFAPFYQDASQRVIAVQFDPYEYAFVMRAEALLKLAREQRGANLAWEEWNAHAIEIPVRGIMVGWVSGPRVFYLGCTEGENGETWMDVQDFSPREFAKCMEPVTDSRDGRFPRAGLPPNVEKHHMPWKAPAIQFSEGSHDSIVVLMVNVSRSRNLTKI